MKRVIGKAGVLAVLLVLTCGISGVANAGYKFIYPGWCGNWNAIGTQQYCTGKLVDIASETADPNRYAWFAKSYSNGVSTLNFHMDYNNVSYNCVAPHSMLDMWSSLMSNKVTFYVAFDTATGTCIYASAGPDSSNTN